MKLRDYQERSINKIKNAFLRGKKRVILRLDCGAGKTCTAAKMCLDTAKRGNEVLFLVHRKELLEQTEETFKKLGAKNEYIKVGMILTVGNNLLNYNPKLIIADECNFALAKSWRKVLDNYPNAYVIGLSATPTRLDGKPMGDLFEEIIEDVNAEDLIKMGNLCEYDYYAPKNIGGFDVKGSDFDMESVAEILEKSKIYGDVLKHINPTHKTIIYCPSIKFSKSLCEKIPNAVHFDGDTPKKERERIIQDFRSGKIRILSNVDLISFGFDVPDCDTVMLLRPTQSLALYIQQSMRCLRPTENKRAIIYDFVGNVYRHGMPTEPREWTLDTKIKCKNINAVPDLLVRECKKCFRVYKGTASICPYCNHDNGKTRKEIEQDEKIELERIEEINRKKARMQVGMTHDFSGLVRLAKERGYKNPVWYAKKIIEERKRKI